MAKYTNAWLDAEVASRPLTALVFFRGSWCPFCQGQIRELNGQFLADLRALGGELYGVTAQSRDVLDAASSDWELDYKVLSDSENQLAQRFEIAITPKDMPGEYQNGMAQPGVVILNQAGEVLVHWAIDPTEANGFGALDRPTPPVIWAALEAARSGNSAVTFEGPKVDAEFLKEKYPTAYEAFDAWMKANAK